MCSLINKQLLLTAYAYLYIMGQQKGQQGSEALQLKAECGALQLKCDYCTKKDQNQIYTGPQKCDAKRCGQSKVAENNRGPDAAIDQMLIDKVAMAFTNAKNTGDPDKPAKLGACFSKLFPDLAEIRKKHDGATVAPYIVRATVGKIFDDHGLDSCQREVVLEEARELFQKGDWQGPNLDKESTDLNSWDALVGARREFDTDTGKVGFEQFVYKQEPGENSKSADLVGLWQRFGRAQFKDLEEKFAGPSSKPQEDAKELNKLETSARSVNDFKLADEIVVFGKTVRLCANDNSKELEELQKKDGEFRDSMQKWELRWTLEKLMSEFGPERKKTTLPAFKKLTTNEERRQFVELQKELVPEVDLKQLKENYKQEWATEMINDHGLRQRLGNESLSSEMKFYMCRYLCAAAADDKARQEILDKLIPKLKEQKQRKDVPKGEREDAKAWAARKRVECCLELLQQHPRYKEIESRVKTLLPDAKQILTPLFDATHITPATLEESVLGLKDGEFDDGRGIIREIIRDFFTKWAEYQAYKKTFDKVYGTWKTFAEEDLANRGVSQVLNQLIRPEALKAALETARAEHGATKVGGFLEGLLKHDLEQPIGPDVYTRVEVEKLLENLEPSEREELLSQIFGGRYATRNQDMEAMREAQRQGKVTPGEAKKALAFLLNREFQPDVEEIGAAGLGGAGIVLRETSLAATAQEEHQKRARQANAKLFGNEERKEIRVCELMGARMSPGRPVSPEFREFFLEKMRLIGIKKLSDEQKKSVTEFFSSPDIANAIGAATTHEELEEVLEIHETLGDEFKIQLDFWEAVCR